MLSRTCLWVGWPSQRGHPKETAFHNCPSKTLDTVLGTCTKEDDSDGAVFKRHNTTGTNGEADEHQLKTEVQFSPCCNCGCGCCTLGSNVYQLPPQQSCHLRSWTSSMAVPEKNADSEWWHTSVFQVVNSIHAPVGCTFISSSKHLLIGNWGIYLIAHNIFWWLPARQLLTFHSIPCSFQSLSLLPSVPRSTLVKSSFSRWKQPKNHTTRHRQPPCTCRRCRHRGSSAVLQGPFTGHRPREICSQYSVFTYTQNMM